MVADPRPDLRQRRQATGAALGTRRRALLQRSDLYLRRHRGHTVEDGQRAGKRYRALGTRGDGFDIILQVDGVDPLGYFFATQSGYGLQNDITFTDLRWHGDHTIKTGIKFKDVELEMRDASTEALYTFFVDPAIPDNGVEADPFEVVFGAQADPASDATAISKNRQYGIYLQDDWVVNDKLLLNLGVRYDYEETPTYTDYVTPQRFVDAIFALDTNGCPLATRTIRSPAHLQLQRRLSRLAARPDLRRHAGQCRHRHQRLHQQRQQPQQSERPDRAAVRIFLRPLRRPGARDLRRRRPELRPQHVQHPAAREQQGDAVRTDDPVLEREQSGLRRPGGRQRPVHRVERRLPDAGRAGVDRPGQLRGDALHQQRSGGALFRPVHARHAQPGGRLEHERRGGVHHELRRRDRKPRELLRGRHLVLVRLVPLRPLNEAPVPNAGGGGLFLFDNAKETETTQVLLSPDKPYSSESPWSASIAYTYSLGEGTARLQRRLPVRLRLRLLLAFVLSDQVAKNRLVAIGTMDLPWGMLGGAKFVIESPKPHTGFNGIGTSPGRTDPPNGLNYNYFKLSQFPNDDDRLHGARPAADEVIRVGQRVGHPGPPRRAQCHESQELRPVTNTFPGPPDYFKQGDISGVPRTFKFSVNFNW